VWIEIRGACTRSTRPLVTPHAGVWIEISEIYRMRPAEASHPTRVCGLKYIGAAEILP